MLTNRVQKLLDTICNLFQSTLGDNLVGIYVHGSLATDSFTWKTSDIDFLAVIERPLIQEEKLVIIQFLLDLLPQTPPKGIEMSIILNSAIKPFRHPISYELHFLICISEL